MTARNRLTNKPGITLQHKTGVEVCKPHTRCPASFPVRELLSLTRHKRCAQLLPGRLLGISKRAAFCRDMMVMLLFLSGYGVAFADNSIMVSGSLRTGDHVHVNARRAGDALLITMHIDSGYHINANPASEEYLIPTSIAFDGVAPERIVYPPATRFKPAFADEPIDVYEGSVVVTATFPAGAGAHDLGFTVTAQACTKEICLPPRDIAGRANW
jgi:hypothetical protein